MAEYIIREILGDDSVPLHANEHEIMQRLHTAVTSDEEIIDLHAHNGAKERYDQFWEMGEIIVERTAVDDCHHGALGDGTAVVNMAISYSYVDLYRM